MTYKLLLSQSLMSYPKISSVSYPKISLPKNNNWNKYNQVCSGKFVWDPAKTHSVQCGVTSVSVLDIGNSIQSSCSLLLLHSAKIASNLPFDLHLTQPILSVLWWWWKWRWEDVACKGPWCTGLIQKCYIHLTFDVCIPCIYQLFTPLHVTTMTRDTWHMTRDTWHMTAGPSHVRVPADG